NGDFNRRLHDSIRMTNDECLMTNEVRQPDGLVLWRARMTESVVATCSSAFWFRHYFVIRHSCFVIYARPLFSSNSRINCLRFRSLGLERSCEMLRCIRRVQFDVALTPGTLNRYLRASRSVIITTAIQDSLLKSACMIAG